MRSLLLVPTLTLTLAAQELPVRLQAAPRRQAEALRTLQADLTLAPAGAWKSYHEAHLAYLLVPQLMGTDRTRAEALLDSAIRLLEPRPDGESLALLAGCLGLKLAFAPDQAMVLGPRVMGLQERAARMAPGSPRVKLLKGVGLLNMPEAFGGGAARALPVLAAAAKAADAEKAPADPMAPAWGRAEAYAWLAMAQAAARQVPEAKASAARALELDPDYGFVRHAVLPRLQAP